MNGFTEKRLVEDHIMEHVDKLWIRADANELEREEDEPLLLRNLYAAIKKINKGIDLSDGDINGVISELQSKPADGEGAKKILEYMKIGVPRKLEKSKELKYVRLFDYNDIENNEFIVSRQVRFQGLKEVAKPDIVFFVNGIPIVVVECKNPAELNVSWLDAYNDIVEYYNEIVPELLKYVQIGIAASEVAKYFAVMPGYENPQPCEWRAEGVEDSVGATIQMLNPTILLDLLRNFIFVRQDKDKLGKIVARWMQFEATNNICNRVIENIKGIEKKNSGLIWHWQGSGKTLTMIFSAYKLYTNNLLGNPTVFFIVDRRDLQRQLYDELSRLSMPQVSTPEVIYTIDELKKTFTHDEGLGKRGLFIVLIQKFKHKELADMEKALRAKGDTIIGRKNIVVFVDEAQRTQYGTLATEVRALLKNAFFFAFTGTPISFEYRNTYRIFSYPDQGEFYLHKYFIDESLKDGFTVPITIKTKREKRINLDREQLDLFIEQDLEELPSEYRKEAENRISKRLNEITVRLKNPERIKIVAQDIAKHFKDNVDGLFKGMVVAVDRQACLLYKQELDNLLPGYSEIIMTSSPKRDPKEIRNYFEELRRLHPGMELSKIQEEIINKFNNEKFPKILIVTDMLLTGFDSPILEVMYLDKPMKGHKLLQAIARTNRPFGELKKAGLIIDYVGILKEYQRALKMYTAEDIEGSAIDVRKIIEEFKHTLSELNAMFRAVPKEVSRESLVAAARVLLSEPQNDAEFRSKYVTIRKLTAFLGYDEVKAYLDDLRWLTAVYMYYIKLTERTDPQLELFARQHFSKVLQEIYKSIDIKATLDELREIKIDENYIKKLKEAYPEEDQQVYNILFSLNKYILTDHVGNPIYESIAERVERIVNEWKQKTIDVKKAHEELSKLLRETVEIEEREKELGLSKVSYYTLIMLEKHGAPAEKALADVKELDKKLNEGSYLYSGWMSKSTAVKAVGALIRSLFLKYRIPINERDGLYEKIINGVRAG
ncbi:MAG: HsdR family type I site-specific deoxyribonuclease [Candidatus Micrarchaeaceae archaeon]